MITDILHEISINELDFIRIGQAEDTEAGTGCTVFIREEGMCAGLDVRGGGPASRDTALLDPLANADTIHAVLLSGGSAFGLSAAEGVMRYLSERGIGYDVGVTRVPLVCQSDLFDLAVGRCDVWPDAEMAFSACVNAEKRNYRDGCFGAGCGATVGKWFGPATSMKSGVGSCAVELGELKIGAVAAVNSLGDIFDCRTHEQIAGLLTEDLKALRSTREIMYRSFETIGNKFVNNTTLGVVMTNGKFSKSQLCKIASMAHNGLAGSISPVHTTADGDSIYALSCGDIYADQDIIGTIAGELMSIAITRAVKSAHRAYGRPSYRDIFPGRK